MRQFRFLLGALCALALTNCGHYRSNNAGWKTPSDYVPSPHGGYSLSEKLSAGQNYIPSGPFRLYWPVKNVRINRGFKPGSPPHQGIDLGGPRGTPILAAHEGVVIYTGKDFRGYGNMVLIEYNKEWATLYGHLNEIATNEGRIVKPGDPIGTMGATGRASGVHLHFELIREREPIDPLRFLSAHRRMAQR